MCKKCKRQYFTPWNPVQNVMLLSDFEYVSQYKSKATDFHPATFILRIDRAGEEGLSCAFSCLIVLLSSFSILWLAPFHFSPQWLLCHFMNQKAFSSKAILLIRYHSDCQIAASFSSIPVSADHYADAVVYIRLRGSSLLPVTGGCVSGRQVVDIHPIMHHSSAKQPLVTSY